jgi:dihydrofolate reductase
MTDGGAGLASNLIVEFRLCIHPILPGSGKPMFPISKQKRILQLIETHHFGSGAVMLRYQPLENVKI